MLRPDDATHLAEQATLGALILDPTHLGAVRPWLRAGDFADALHGQVYAALCERHTAGEPTDPAAMVGALTGRAPGLSPGVRVHDLIAAVPAVANGQHYARTVTEAGLRREIAGLGVLLRAGALQCALARESVPMTSTCALVDAALVSVARRWDAATGTARTPVESGPSRFAAALRNPELHRAADKLLDTHPGRDLRAEEAHEALLVGHLVTHPHDVLPVGAFLPPQRLACAPWRTVYAATLELSELGLPVDLVTVAHATARLSHHGQPAPTMAQLATTVEAARHLSLVEVEQAVRIDQIRRIADNGADQLLKGAANPGLHLGDLIDTGRIVVGALRDNAQMLPTQRGGPSPGGAVRPVLTPHPGPVAG